jgi:hypothetical protein
VALVAVEVATAGQTGKADQGRQGEQRGEDQPVPLEERDDPPTARREASSSPRIVRPAGLDHRPAYHLELVRDDRRACHPTHGAVHAIGPAVGAAARLPRRPAWRRHDRAEAQNTRSPWGRVTPF